MPKLSIIVPVYNIENYIERCVRTILAQTFKDFELILIDDGSVDTSGELCDKLAKEDKRIYVIHKSNGGVSSARNYGLKIARGKYIMFCDGDDYVRTEWCQCMVDIMNKNDNASMGICGYQFVDVQSDEILGNINYSEQDFICESKAAFWQIYMKNLLSMPWNKIYRTDIVKENNIEFDESLQYNEDLLFVLEYIKKSSSGFAICNSPLYFYVRGIEGSLTHRYVPDLWEIKKRIFQEMDVVISQSGIDTKKIETDYYSKGIWHIVSAISSELSKQNNRSVAKKYQNLKGILKSKICRDSFRYGDFSKTATGVYAWVMKTRSTMLIMLYYQLSWFIRRN